MAKSSYAGKISNGGTQVVKAPAQVKGGKGRKTVRTGNDLRNKG